MRAEWGWEAVAVPDTLISFIRGTLAFFSLLVLTRLMGKQQVQQLNFFEYVTGITIGSIAAASRPICT